MYPTLAKVNYDELGDVHHRLAAMARPRAAIVHVTIGRIAEAEAAAAPFMGVVDGEGRSGQTNEGKEQGLSESQA
jgi:hypothetical protein